MTLFIIIIIIV